MPAPTQLTIATSAVNRLVKEEASYHKELEQQQARIVKLQQDGGDENAEYQLKQEVYISPVPQSLLHLSDFHNSKEPSMKPRPSSLSYESASRMHWPSCSSNS